MYRLSLCLFSKTNCIVHVSYKMIIVLWYICFANLNYLINLIISNKSNTVQYSIQYYNLTVLKYYNIKVLQFYSTKVPPHYIITVLKRNKVLQYYSTLVLQYYRIIRKTLNLLVCGWFNSTNTIPWVQANNPSHY